MTRYELSVIALQFLWKVMSLDLEKEYYIIHSLLALCQSQHPMQKLVQVAVAWPESGTTNKYYQMCCVSSGRVGSKVS